MVWDGPCGPSRRQEAEGAGLRERRGGVRGHLGGWSIGHRHPPGQVFGAVNFFPPSTWTSSGASRTKKMRKKRELFPKKLEAAKELDRIRKGAARWAPLPPPEAEAPAVALGPVTLSQIQWKRPQPPPLKRPQPPPPKRPPFQLPSSPALPSDLIPTPESAPSLPPKKRTLMRCTCGPNASGLDVLLSCAACQASMASFINNNY